MDQSAPSSSRLECTPLGEIIASRSLGATSHIHTPLEECETAPEPDVEGCPYVGQPEPLTASNNTKQRTVETYSVHMVLLLVPASILGLLARIGLIALGSYNGQGVFPLALVQGVGCFIMGIWLGIRDPISERYPEMYIAATSGFCGSLTTFSAMQLDIFLSWSNSHVIDGDRRAWIYSIVDGVVNLLVTLAVSWSAVGLGRTLSAKHVLPILKSKTRSCEWISAPFFRQVVNVSSLAMYIAALILYLVLSPAYRPIATSALLFAFPGAFIRYGLANTLNSKTKAMPLGTLAANILGTLLLGVFYDLERTYKFEKVQVDKNLSTPCVMFKGLSDGFTGCLTTVSSFVVELRALRYREAWVYGTLSIFVGQALMAVIVGSALWGGYMNPDMGCLSPTV